MKGGVVVFLLLICPVIAADYYIDYENGDDNNDGLTEATAWKHSPGDSNALANPGSANILPGDRILFRGDVVYRGGIDFRQSGDADNKIVLSGNSWGTGKAVIDGSTPITTGWTQCTAQDCMDNSFYQNIYHTEAPADFFTGFFEDDNFLWYSQDPNPQDHFYYDKTDEYRIVPFGSATVTQTTTSLTDPNYFSQDSGYWDESYIITWRIPNVVDYSLVTSYDPASHTITYEELGGSLYNDREGYYSMLNNIGLIDRPREYAVVNGKLYVYGDPSVHEYSYLTGNTGIRIPGQKNIIVEGFDIRKFVMGIRTTDCENIIIKDNDVHSLNAQDWYAIQLNGDNIAADGNTVINAQRAVGILMSGSNITVSNNYIERASRQGIWCMGVDYAIISNNTVYDVNGMHSNGISVYLHNTDILMAHNKVLNTGSSMTYHGDSNPSLYVDLTIYGNIFDNRVNSWGKDMRGVRFINNLVGGNYNVNPEDQDTIVINNIIHGGGGDDYRSHNIYTDLMWWQEERYDWFLSEGEILEEYTPLIYDNNFRLFNESIAVDSGTNPSQHLPVDKFPDYDFYTDLDSNIRPSNVWDIGPYEFTGQCIAMQLSDLIIMIDEWKMGNYTIEQLIDAIGKWKNGC